jgi:hypothetical protein
MEKILNLIMATFLDKQEWNKSARLQHSEKMTKVLNDNMFGNTINPGNYSVRMDKNTGELGGGVNDSSAKDVELILSNILQKLFTKSDSNCEECKT